jgi:hypothetical protein
MHTSLGSANRVRSMVRLCIRALVGPLMVLLAAGGPPAQAATPGERFMRVNAWNLTWTAKWTAQGTDVVDDVIRMYDYYAESSGTLLLTAEDPYNPYGRTWRVADGSGPHAEFSYIESNNGTVVRRLTADGSGTFESVPFSIDAYEGTYNLSLPDVVVTGTDDNRGIVVPDLPLVVVTWHTMDPTWAVANLSGRPLPATGLTIHGTYSFSSPFPLPSVYIPAGVQCTVDYTYTPAGQEDPELVVTKLEQQGATAGAKTDFVFHNGKLVVLAEATVKPKDLVDSVEWEVPAIGSGAEPAVKKSVNRAKGIAKVRVTYAGLPADNDGFGEKTIRAFVTDPALNAARTFRVFFKRDGKDHPETTGKSGAKTPNWYHYWSQGPAPGLSDFEYVAGEDGGAYDPNTGERRIGADAVRPIPALDLSLSSRTGGTAAVSRERREGLAAVATIVAHENMHKHLFEGVPPGTIEEDSPTPVPGDTYIPGDRVGPLDESGTPPSTDPGLRNTYGLAVSHFYPDPRNQPSRAQKRKYQDQLDGFGDNEIKAIFAEKQAKWDASRDWAFPGSQTPAK